MTGRVVQSEIIVEYDTYEEMKQGNRDRNAEKWSVWGKHKAEGKFYVYYRKRIPFVNRVEEFFVKCTTAAYGNFIKDKIYIAKSRYVHSNGNPSYYQITDEDGDDLHIGDSPLKPLHKGFELYVEED